MEEIKKELAEVLYAILSIEGAMAQMAPDMALRMGPILEHPEEDRTPEKVLESVNQMVEMAPEEQREQFAKFMLEEMKKLKEHLDFTKWRLDSRIQPEGQLREKRQFKSFCKRKPKW